MQNNAFKPWQITSFLLVICAFSMTILPVHRLHHTKAQVVQLAQTRVVDHLQHLRFGLNLHRRQHAADVVALARTPVAVNDHLADVVVAFAHVMTVELQIEGQAPSFAAGQGVVFKEQVAPQRLQIGLTLIRQYIASGLTPGKRLAIHRYRRHAGKTRLVVFKARRVDEPDFFDRKPASGDSHMAVLAQLPRNNAQKLVIGRREVPVKFRRTDAQFKVFDLPFGNDQLREGVEGKDAAGRVHRRQGFEVATVFAGQIVDQLHQVVVVIDGQVGGDVSVGERNFDAHVVVTPFGLNVTLTFTTNMPSRMDYEYEDK